MATYFARKAGNINAADVWATTPSGTAAAVTFASGDVLVSNSFAITINVDTNLGGSGQLRNDTLGGATANGTFTLAAGVTLTANILQNNASGGATVVTCGVSAPQSASIVGNVTSPVSSGGGNTPINLTGNGTLNFTGNATGDLKIVLGGAGGAIQVTQGTLNFTGNATGGGGAFGYAIYNTGGTVNITGNCLGAVAPAVALGGLGTINITGQAIGTTTSGGGAGVANLSTGAVFAKRAVGGSFGPGSSGVTAAPGIANSSTGIVQIEELEYGTFGMSPTSGGGIRLKKASSNVAVFNYCDTEGAKNLIDATQNAAMPAANHVRSGVSYASGALTGTCAVPAAGSVALGVPVDATTGTAVLTPAAIRAELATELARIDTTISSRLSPSGTLATVTTLTNAPTVPTAAAIATQVRSELSVELGRVDQAISSRLAGSAYTAPANSEISAIKAKTDALPASPAAVSDIPTTAQISAAVEGSLLNEGDGQAVLNAIVGAIGNTNLSEVSLVAAVRADLERNGGKLDSVPTAAANASAVWGTATKQITGGVVDTLTNAPASVTPSDIWSHSARTLTSASGPTASEIRQEMDSNSTKLANLDSTVSSRLAGSAYTAPSTPPTAIQIRQELDANSTKLDVAVSSRLAASEASKLDAVKAKTDALNTERLANVATTAIVGNLIAQANS